MLGQSSSWRRARTTTRRIYLSRLERSSLERSSLKSHLLTTLQSFQKNLPLPAKISSQHLLLISHQTQQVKETAPRIRIRIS